MYYYFCNIYFLEISSTLLYFSTLLELEVVFSMSFLVIYFFTMVHITCYISSATLKQAGTLDGLNNIKVVFDITCMLVMDNESLLDKSHRRTLNEMRRGNKVDSTDLKNSRVLKA